MPFSNKRTGTVNCDVLHRATVDLEVVGVESVSQREMRNNSGDLLRRVAEGETVVVTNNGVPAAVLVPAAASVRTRLAASGRLKVGTGVDVSALPSPITSTIATEDILEEDRDR